jgi:hypothetical protein
MRSDDEGREPKVSAKTRIVASRDHYHRKSADGDNPCPDRRDRICTSDPTPIKRRKVG